MAPRAPAHIRFKRFYTPTAGCWHWTGHLNNMGYGQFHIGGQPILAHRASYTLYVGAIPPNAKVLHACDTPSCVNPAHLFLGTQSDNMKDMTDKGRRIKGDNHPKAKLTNIKVKIIRKYKGRVRLTKMAEIFKVSKQTILDVWNNRYWRHVT